jgi:tetratricopeptide (TPR) repeat protein
LEKDSENVQALWGAALVAEHDRDYERVVELTRRVLAKDPQYKFGDVSLALGRALDELGEPEAARDHLEQHVRRWRHPEGLFRLARLCDKAGDTAAARQHLRALLQDLAASPTAIARKYGRWKSRARQMLKRL